jgi:peptidoglycan/LPS O-acetylase OafA/YrhL
LLNNTYYELAKDISKWLGFGVLGLGNINDIHTKIINAGVLWSLSYEWLFYFTLPLISIVIVRPKPQLLVVLISLVFISVALQFRAFHLEHIMSFIGGAIAPILLKYSKKKININNLFFSLLLIISLISIFQFNSSGNGVCKMLITISFTIISLGNNLFGLLKNSTLKFLGEISYSTYLLHGLIIFITIHFIYGFEEAKLLSKAHYFILMFIISPFVILISSLTFRFIEKPFVKRGKRFTTSIPTMKPPKNCKFFK